MTGPKAYRAIMVSSTFSDLEEHRRDAIEAIEKLGFRANVMEVSGARADADVVDASINMVRDSAAFVGVISHKYGQTPACPVRNPGGLSISELEFNEAMRLQRPILLFIMGDSHPLTIADVESDPEKKLKLDAFRERAKRMRDDGAVERIYEIFNSRQDFARAASVAMGKLSQTLTPHDEEPAGYDEQSPILDSIETALPPDLRAVPRYLGSHEFIGRAAELGALDDWCSAADPNPMLLFEAIGGSGKSMVTWTWLTSHATKARGDWAGRFWFSFYERGATMASFCREALAYMTGQPATALQKEKVRTLMPRLIAELTARPWLIVLDGLERILVAYHRIDASQMRDEDVDMAEDQIASRDPRTTIGPEDEDLLRELIAAAPSKILVTSRLTPQALINRSGMPMPGVRREMLPGLRPVDAEAFVRACGVSGDSLAIREYLQRNCDCHPLVIGALTGLVNNYMPDRGNFDTWLADPEAGGRLGLGDLDLTQRRNHILDAAIEALPEPARRLLQTLSLLQGGADYATLKEFNPHRPPPPREVKEPSPPEMSADWMTEREMAAAETKFTDARKAHATYIAVLNAWEQSPQLRAAAARFDETLADLERRGLLQYERGHKLYDLHPVVRGIAAGRMGEKETREIGRQVVDHFSSRPHDVWEKAETLKDLAPGIQVVVTLSRMGRLQEAFNAYDNDLGIALASNLLAFGEMQRLLRPFFPYGWEGPIALDSEIDQCSILISVANTFYIDNPDMCIRIIDRAIALSVRADFGLLTAHCLRCLAGCLGYHGKLSEAQKIKQLHLELSEGLDSDNSIYRSLIGAYWGAIYTGLFEKCDEFWCQLDPSRRDWGEAYRCGEPERARVEDLWARGELTESILAETEQLCRKGRDRFELIQCLGLRGEWHLSRGEPALAIRPLTEGLHLCRDSGVDLPHFDLTLALAHLRAGHPASPRDVAESISETQSFETALALAELWHELGEPSLAVSTALRAHKLTCGSGEPYVYRHYLNRADELLRKFGQTPPEVPRHDPAQDRVFEWEEDIRAMIIRERDRRESAEQMRKAGGAQRTGPRKHGHGD